MVSPPKRKQLSFDTVVIAAPATQARELLRSINELVSLEFVRELARPYFAERGRPCIDPVLMIKMMLVGYLFGINSDRRLVDECADRLSFREFLGCLSDEPMPVHSSFTHWRQRLGPEFFRELLHQIVEQCVGRGMKLSGARCVDGTRVKAQASRGGPLVEVPKGADVDEYVQEYFAQDPAAKPGPQPLPDPDPEPDGDAGPDGDADPEQPAGPPLRLAGDAPSDGDADPEQPQTIAINTHDPDARLDARPGERAEFRYSASLCSDAESGLITDATALPREAAGTAVEHIDHDPGKVHEFVGDTLYNDAATLTKLQKRGVRCYVPEPEKPADGQLTKRYFRYDRERNLYICPRGKELKWSRYHKKRRAHFYTAKVSDCQHCPLKDRCTTAKRRSVSRLLDEDAREATHHSGRRYRYLMSRRRINEHLNLLGKRDHGLSRARGLGLAAMQVQVAMVATAIDLKKLVTHVTSPTVALLPPVAAAFLRSVCPAALWLALQGAAASIWRALRAALTNIPTIPHAHTIQPQPAQNRGF